MNWKSKWIWVRDHSRTQNFYIYARREFEIDNTFGAYAFISASSEYKLYINGRCIGSGSGYCALEHMYYDKYDVSHILKSGKNVVAAIAYNYGVETNWGPSASGGLIFQLDIQNHNENKTILCSDESWRVKPADDWNFLSQRMSDYLGFQEWYDARKKPVGWNVIGYDDSSWECAEIVSDACKTPFTNLLRKNIPDLYERKVYPKAIIDVGYLVSSADECLDVAQMMRPESRIQDDEAIECESALIQPNTGFTTVSPKGDVYITLDFGREVVGYPVIKVASGGFSTIDFIYGESLDNIGDHDCAIQADRAIFDGGRREFQTFGRRAFRYMQLFIRKAIKPVQIESVYIKHVGYPVEHMSNFECSDDLLNRILLTGIHTLSLCMQSSYENSPLTRRVNCMNSLLEMLQNFYCYNDSLLAAKEIRQFAITNFNCGVISKHDSIVLHDICGDDIAWVMFLHNYCLYTGDIDILKDVYSCLRGIVENQIKNEHCKDILCAIFRFKVLLDSSEIASAFGCNEDVFTWKSRAYDYKKVLCDEYWSNELGIFIDADLDNSQSSLNLLANILAVLFDVADKSQIDSILSYFGSIDNISACSNYYANFFFLQMLAKLRKTHTALSFIRSFWVDMLNNGASTWHESVDLDSLPNNRFEGSFCSAGSGIPTYFLPAEILGVKPQSISSDTIVVRPSIGDIEWARGKIRVREKYIGVNWHFCDGQFVIDIDSEAGFIVALPIKNFEDPVIDEIDLCDETPEKKARKTYGWGTTIWRDGKEHDPYADWLVSQGSDIPLNYKYSTRCSIKDGYIWVLDNIPSRVRYIVYEKRKDISGDRRNI